MLAVHFLKGRTPNASHVSSRTEGFNCEHILRNTLRLNGYVPLASASKPSTCHASSHCRGNIVCRDSAIDGVTSATPTPASKPDATLGQPTSTASSPLPPASSAAALQTNMQTRYEQAYSMSELYASERPPPIPAAEHERRRRVKDIQEVIDAGRRRGLADERVRSGLTALEALLPGVLSLHRMKPADWATVASDVDGLAEKIIFLKSLYPRADIFKIVFKKPKLLMLTTERLEQDAAAILRLLSSAPDPAAILEATPDLVDPLSLSRCLASLASSFPGQDPVLLLQQHPDMLANTGAEAAVELTAEYGELSTKD